MPSLTEDRPRNSIRVAAEPIWGMSAEMRWLGALACDQLGARMVATSVTQGSSMKQSTGAQASSRGVAIPESEPLTPPTVLKGHMGLYQAPRVVQVAQFLQHYGERRPIPVA